MFGEGLGEGQHKRGSAQGRWLEAAPPPFTHTHMQTAAERKFPYLAVLGNAFLDHVGRVLLD